MTVRKLSFPVLLVCMFGLLGSVGTASGQTVLVTAKSVSELTDDLEYLIKSVSPEGDPIAQSALNALNQFKSGAMLKGVDRSHSFALAVTLPKGFPQEGSPTIVAAVPVSDLGQFLDSLKDLGLAVDDQPGVAGFSHKVSMPNGTPTFFVLQSKGYVLFSPIPDGADRLKALDPSSWKPKGRDQSTLSVKVQLSEVPEALKEQFLNQVEANLNQQNDRKPGEGDAEFQGRIAGQKLGLDAFNSLIRDGDAIALDLDLSRKTSELALELAISAKPNTAMAKTLRTLGGRRSRFQGLGKDAAMAVWVNLPVAKQLREVISNAFDQGAKDGLNKVGSEDEKKIYTRFAELVKSNLNAPEIDLGIAIQGGPPAGPGASRFVMLSGMKVENGGEFEKLVREAAAKIKAAENVKITFDVAKAADGTAIHQMNGPVDDKNTLAAKHFGKASLFFAFRGDAVLASFGETGLESLRRALEGFSDPPASGVNEPVAAVLRLSSLGALAEQNQEGFGKAVAEVFPGDAPKHDRVSLALKGEGDEIRLRLAVDVPALKLMAVMGRQMQK